MQKRRSFSAALAFVPLHDQTHRELVYGALQFQKCSQDFFGTHNETLSVAMRVHNSDCSPFEIES